MSGSGSSHEFADVLGMARLSNGSIALADGMLDELRLYTPDGGFVGSAGREGEGPGEFSGGIYEMVMAAGDTSWVRDWGRRVSMFGPDLTPVRTFGLTSPVSGIYDLEDGTMVVGIPHPVGGGSDVGGLVQTPTALWRFDLAGNRLDSIGEYGRLYGLRQGVQQGRCHEYCNAFPRGGPGRHTRGYSVRGQRGRHGSGRTHRGRRSGPYPENP